MIKMMMSISLIILSLYQTNFLVYQGETFTIDYDIGWNVENKNDIIYFFSKKENEDDLFLENVNIIIQTFSDNSITMHRYTEITLNQIINNLGEDSILELNNIEVQGYEGKEIIYNMPINSPTEQKEELKIRQRWFIKGNKAYLLTYTAKKDTYSKYIEIINEMFNSFKIKY